jgi:hypothetical protein
MRVRRRGDAVHGFDLKAEAGAGLAQQREVAGTPGAEAEVVADDQMPDAQRADQHLLDERFGAQGGEGGVEVADVAQVDAVVGEQFEFFAQRGQARRRRFRGEELARVRLEREHGSRQAGVRRGRRQAGEQRTMTEMYAIEVADGQYGGTVRCAGKTAIDEHRGQVRAKKTCNYNQFRAPSAAIEQRSTVFLGPAVVRVAARLAVRCQQFCCCVRSAQGLGGAASRCCMRVPGAALYRFYFSWQ